MKKGIVMDDVVKVAAEFGIGRVPSREQLDADSTFDGQSDLKRYIAGCGEQIQRLDLLRADLEKAATNVRRSTDYTATGRKAELGRLALNYGQRLESLGTIRYLAHLRRLLEGETRMLGEGRATKSLSLSERLAVISELRESGLLDVTVPLGVVELVRNSIEMGDDVLPESLLLAPIPLRRAWLADEQVEALLVEWNIARSPAQAKIVTTLSKSIRAVEERLAAAREDITRIGGASGDPLALAAGGA
ncbi:MAG: hypothetical protein KDA20_00230 [Phycisphaerales bacterium]|nr:hypothetical protein [Phycisphaerales bacterium]